MKKIISICFVIIILLLFSQIIFAETGAIQGEVHYAGSKIGPVIVAAFNLQLDFNNLIQLDTLQAGPGPYKFENLQSGNYLVAAFMDVNLNGLPGFVEPVGAHPGLIEVAEEVVSDVDIYLKDLPEGDASISGVVHYNGQQQGKIHVYAIGLSETPIRQASPAQNDNSYTISGLMAGEYVLAAFLDMNDNDIPDLGEPLGFYDQPVEVKDKDILVGYDITLFERQDFSGSITGTITYEGADSGNVYIVAVGLTHSPISITTVEDVKSTPVQYTIPNLDAGEYYLRAYLDVNGDMQFNRMNIELTGSFPVITLGEPYDIIVDPVVVVENQSTTQDLALSEQGDAGISGNITYKGDQKGLVLAIAVGLSPSWFGFYPAKPGDPQEYSYTIPYLDAGIYAVISLMIDLKDPKLDLSIPVGFYTNSLVTVTPHDTVENINFFMEDSSTERSSITCNVTTPPESDGNIKLFALGISLTPLNDATLTEDGQHIFSDLRMGRYLVAGFKDVDNDGSFDFKNEPYAITTELINIPHGGMNVTVNLDLMVDYITDLEPVAENFIPNEFALGHNYPNPFNPETHFKYQVAETKFVTIKVYNMLGKEVATLVDEQKSPGLYDVVWDGRDIMGNNVASGIYIYAFKAGEFFDVKTMTLIR